MIWTLGVFEKFAVDATALYIILLTFFTLRSSEHNANAVECGSKWGYSKLHNQLDNQTNINPHYRRGDIYDLAQ